MTLRCLFVARWYPSHDQPGRGSFVADLAMALRQAGAEVVVASFEPVRVRGAAPTRTQRAASAAAAFAEAITGPNALNVPRSWGAPGLPVARLPVVLDGGRREPQVVVDAHAAALVPFGLGLAGRWPFDIIHAHTGLPDGAAASLLADRLGLPLVVSEHSSTIPDELSDPEAAALYRRLVEGQRRRAMAVSRTLARRVTDRLGFAPSAVGVMPNAVPIDMFPAPSDEGRDPDELLFAGTRKATKGMETLLRAFAIVRSERSNLRLRLIGSPGQPSEDERWRELGVQLGVDDAVSFEPEADRKTVAAAMRRAAIFVHPSPFETFGMVVAEALASGLAVAATPSGGVEEILGAGGACGEVATASDPVALARAIGRLLDRRSSIDPAQLRARVESAYSASAIAARTVRLYEELRGLQRRPPDSGRGPDVAAFRLPLVVALNRAATPGELSDLPSRLAARLTGITSAIPPAAAAAESAALPPLGRWIELDAERPYRERRAAMGRVRPGWFGRLMAFGQRPIVRWQRERLVARREQMRRQTTIDALRAAWEEVNESGRTGGPDAAGDSGAPSEERALALAIDADDALAVSSLAGYGIELAPGSVRWLVDRWDAAGRP